MPLDSIFNNWFITPSQKKEQEQMYLHKMLPFGNKQKKWEDDIIEKIFVDDSKIIPTIKYMCYTRREMFIDATVNDEYLSKKYKKLCRRMKLSEEQIAFVDKFAKLEYDVKSASDFPSLQEVKEKCL